MSTSERRRAAAEAGHRGDEAAARSALADVDPSVRSTALGALARAGALRPTDVAAAVADPAPTVRRRACEESRRLEAPDLVPVLSDDDAAVVEAAAWALGERAAANPGVVAGLTRVVEAHTDALCREAAVAALGAIGDPDGLAAILASLTDKPAVRRRAIIALAAFDGPEVDAALQQALTDRDWQVRQAAEDLLA